MSNAKYYAVARGRNPGVYYSWEECEKETKGWPNAVFEKFAVEKQAWDFVKANCPNTKLSAGASGSSPKKRGLQDDGAIVGSSIKITILERLQKIEDKIEEFHKHIVKEIDSLKKEVLMPTPYSKKIAFIDLEDAPSPYQRPKTLHITGQSTENSVKKVKFDGSDKGYGSDEFKMNAEGYVEVYTDGACSNNGFKGAQAGIGVWFGDGHRLNLSEPVKGRITNNSAEIEAATAAIEAAHTAGIKKLKLYTDSNFLISAINVWIKTWEKNGWKTSNREPVKNKEELILLNNARSKMDVIFEHVKGHAGNYENEQADSLARAGAAKCVLTKMF